MGTYSVTLAGTSHYQDAIGRAQEGERVDLVPEPSNRFDRSAVAAITEFGEFIGYLPRDTFLKRMMLEEGKAVYALLQSKHGGWGDKPTMGVTLEVVTGEEAESMSASDKGDYPASRG